jgi:protein-tyrosine-phosphatase
MRPTGEPFNILFICTGNSARSIFGEYLIERIGKGLFRSYSAGANPVGRVNPYAQRVLKEVYRIDASEARSKGFEDVEAKKFDFVITVCDRAKESCPVWPGQPIIAHWGAPDPALAEGTDEQIYQQFKQVAMLIQRRIELLCALPFDKIDRLRLQILTEEIGTRTLN